MVVEAQADRIPSEAAEIARDPSAQKNNGGDAAHLRKAEHRPIRTGALHPNQVRDQVNSSLNHVMKTRTTHGRRNGMLRGFHFGFLAARTLAVFVRV
jgi:hypothetical protein